MTNQQIVPLGDIASIQAGVGFPSRLQGRTSGRYPFAKVGDISRLARQGHVELRKADNYVDESDLATLKARPFPTGTVVFPKIGEAIRQNHRAITSVECLLDNNVMGVIAKSSVDHKYLYHFLRSVDLYPLATSTTVPSLRKSTLERIPVPLPSLARQRKVADVLDRADELRAKRREALAHLDNLANSVFLDLFAQQNNQNWETSLSLGSVADITSGITKGRRTTQNLRSVPYMAVLNVQDKRLELSTVKHIEATEEEINRYRLRKDDLLLTEGGDPDKLGRGTLWNEELPEAIHQNHIFRVRITSPDRVHPVYLTWLVSSQWGKSYFLRSSKQTTGIASINKNQLRQFPLILPPHEMQKDFANRIANIERSKATHETSLGELDALFSSLQDRAFRGAL